MSTPKKVLLRRLTWVMWGLALLMAVLVFSMRAMLADAERAADDRSTRVDLLPVLHPAPDFSLTNRDGTTVELEDLAGKPWVADFVFTRCPGVCPIMTQRMSELVAELPEGSARYVSISVDPEHDTPEVLQAYAEKHDAGPDWYFLTGAKDVIYPLIREGFLLALDDAPSTTGGAEAAEPIVHSNRFVLVDSDGRIRGYYNSFNEEELARLRVDLQRLAG